MYSIKLDKKFVTFKFIILIFVIIFTIIIDF